MSNNDSEDETVFERKIESDGNICNNCYRKLREHFETMHDVATPITEYEDHADFSYFDDFRESGRPNVHKAYCKCGSVDWNETRIRPMDEDAMERAAIRVVDRLMEKGYSVDEESFFDFIDERFDLPEWQMKEDRILELAVEDNTYKPDERDSDGDVLIV